MARCVCKKSTKFPICDGSHTHNGWSCKTHNQTTVEACFLTSSNYYPLVEGLSSQYIYPAVHKSKTNLRVEICYLISDGIDWNEIKIQLQKVEADHWVLFSLYRDPRIILSALQKQIANQKKITFEGRKIENDDFLFTEISHQLHMSSSCTLQNTTVQTKNIFLSHAVDDEDILHKTINNLASFPVEFFICSSSIQIGSNWYEEILTSLKLSDLFLFIHSPRSHTSTFCAFECGIAQTLQKNIRVFSLISPPLPAYLQHIQAIDLQRIKNEQPWLTEEECINEGFFRAIFS